MRLTKLARVHSFSSFRLCFTSTYKGKLVPPQCWFHVCGTLSKTSHCCLRPNCVFLYKYSSDPEAEAQPQCSASNGNICFWQGSLKNHICTWTTVFLVSFKSHGWLLAFGGRFILDDIRHLYALSHLQISREGLKMVGMVKRLWL